MLRDADMSKVLIFGRTKYGVERLAKDLNRSGVKAEAIHGDKTFNNRLRALEKFKKDEAQVLVATDVAARGLDISGVSHVINFDLPQSYDDYVHRIGRTGRAGKAGKALTFVQ
jgi:superfamily II DNA/RNA helicase